MTDTHYRIPNAKTRYNAQGPAWIAECSELVSMNVSPADEGRATCMKCQIMAKYPPYDVKATPRSDSGVWLVALVITCIFTFATLKLILFVGGGSAAQTICEDAGYDRYTEAFDGDWCESQRGRIALADARRLGE